MFEVYCPFKLIQTHALFVTSASPHANLQQKKNVCAHRCVHWKMQLLAQKTFFECGFLKRQVAAGLRLQQAVVFKRAKRRKSSRIYV